MTTPTATTTTILLRYDDGTPALWLEETEEGTTINDLNTRVALSPDELDRLPEIIQEWMQAVDWEGTR